MTKEQAKEFSVGPMQDSGVLYIYSMRDQVLINPSYQRDGGIWTAEKRQLLIDSILNGFDIPKIYFHEYSPPRVIGGRKYRYAIVDGRQRLESIWGFINGNFAIATDFEYILDPKLQLGGLTYQGLAEKHPELKMRFDGRTLPITLIRTAEIDLIEEMFSRLNEAVPLNAAEKRNAWGGPMPAIIREVAKHKFFTEKVKVTRNRYKHLDIATKFLLFEYSKKVTDTKKVYLDSFVKSFKASDAREAKKLQQSVVDNLERFAAKFIRKDPLLSSIGMLSLYYWLIRESFHEGWYDRIQRSVFELFEKSIRDNRELAAAESDEVDYSLVEFHRLGQSPNDAYAIRYRLDVLTAFVKGYYGFKPIRKAKSS